MATYASAAPAMANGDMASSMAEDEELVTQLLRLRDSVLAGKHAQFKLPQSAIEQLKATLMAPAAPDAVKPQSLAGSTANLSAFAANQQQPISLPVVNGLPGLTAPNSTSARPTTGGLDPIFLEKSDSLVRAEGQLKRQRIERDLQAQVDQRKHIVPGRDLGAEGPSHLDIDAILKKALERAPPLSGLKSAARAGSDTSFDENDYYSSQVQSDWSSDASSSKGSDKGLGGFTGDYERLDNAPHFSTALAESSRPARNRALRAFSSSKGRPHVSMNELDDAYEHQDEDEEYTPPDAAAFDNFRDNNTGLDVQQFTLPEDDNSDYEPGEITQESAVPTPQYQDSRAAQASPRVPVIHNRLTHLAAPQPSRVSPLATAKGPSIELELVNGRPEIVQKSMQSRVSTASPSGNGFGGPGKKRRNKKRKREQELQQRSKKRRDRHTAAQSPVSPAQREPHIKDEPMSPPPFGNMPEVRPYDQSQYRPTQIDLVSPRYAPQTQYARESLQPAPRYDHTQPPSPAVVRGGSPAAYRAVQRDTQDLRRIASMHHAQRPTSATQRYYSPVVPYLAASTAYGEQRPVQLHSMPVASEAPRYQEIPGQEIVQHARARGAQSPLGLPEYSDPYGTRAQSPAPMPLPPPRRIIVDQFGNRYYSAESAPPPASIFRASVAPTKRRPPPEPLYERAPSRLAYAQDPTAMQYQPAESAMAPPPPPTRRQEQPLQYIDANNYRGREYSTRPAEPLHYAEASTSPTYQTMPRYEPMAPPAAPPTREPTSPVYQQLPRAYSVRPEEPAQHVSGYVRQPSVVPVQYVRQDMAPPPRSIQPPAARAVSVMPGTEYGTPVQHQPPPPPPPTYSYAPQPVKYVDQYGREVYPQQVRQVSEFRYP